MLLRPIAAFLLFVASAPAQSPEKLPVLPWASPLATFKVTDFNLTFSYPKKFAPADAGTSAPASYTLPSPRPADAPCAQAPLSVGYTDNNTGNSVLALSIIDDACPSVLSDASKLGPFTHTQLMRQLQRYGVPSLTHEATLFTVDGRPAAITTASAHATETQQGDTLTTTYAAKVCLFAEQPSAGVSPSHIVCFDFTTQQRNLLPAMLAFPIQVGDRSPKPLVPATVLR